MTLYLVGTIHIDPKGAQRLDRIFTRYEPTAIAIEATERTAREHMKRHNTALDKDTVEQIEEAIRRILPPLTENDANAVRTSTLKSSAIPGFEIRSAYAYAQQRNIALVHADPWIDLHQDKVSAVTTDLVAETVRLFADPKTRTAILEQLHNPMYDEMQQEAYDGLIAPETMVLFRQITEDASRQSPMNKSLDTVLNPKREQMMADTIRNTTTKGERTISVTGGLHIPYLYRALEDLQPRVLDTRTSDDGTETFLRGLSNL